MKKTRILAMLMAAVLLFAAIPMTVGAAPKNSSIVKETVEFDGTYAVSDSYFAIGTSLYDNGGNKLYTLENEDEVIYTLTDNCFITLEGSAVDIDDFDNLEYSFNLYSIEDGKVTFKSAFENYPLVMPYNGWDYTSVIHVDLSGILDSDFEDFDDVPLYGYDILDSYGNVIYSDKDQVAAEPVGNGLFAVSHTSIFAPQNLIKVTDSGVAVVPQDFVTYFATESGDTAVMDFEYRMGIINSDGKIIVPAEYVDVVSCGDYYIAYVEDEDDPFAYAESHVYSKGRCIFKYDGNVTYFNGKIAVVTVTTNTAEFGEVETGAIITVSETPEVIYEGDNIWAEGGYVVSENVGITNEGVAIFDLDGNLIIENADWWDFHCADLKNGSFIVTDYSICETYRVDSTLSRVETLEFLKYYEESYDNVTVRYTGLEPGTYCLEYKGEAITLHHEMFDSRITLDGCEVYLFMDGLEDFDAELTYTAYIVSGIKSPFNDMSESHWAMPYVNFCFETGIMNGTGGGNFSPDMEVSRAQVVTTLWRLAGSPAPEGDCDFVDVADGQWYTDAVVWAAQCGITTGVGGNSFAPDRAVTRGEVAAIIYRFAEAMGEDTDGRTDLSAFVDTSELADWNRDAFAWCAECGIITGKTGARLAPNDTLTRAELAAILCRY